MVWLLQFDQLVGFERKVFVVWLFQLGQLVVLSVKMCGMAVTICSTCGF